MATGSINQKAIDQRGKGVAGLSIAVYVVDTQTLATLTDLDDVSLPNPLTTDANGDYSYKTDTGLYDEFISNAGELVGVNRGQQVEECA